jgi:hypothetical protein
MRQWGGVIRREDMDEKLVELFMKWRKAFESVQVATKEKDLVAAHKHSPSSGLRLPRRQPTACAGWL